MSKKYTGFQKQKSLKDHRPVRWTVAMNVPNSPENIYGAHDNFVSYHNSLDAGKTSSLSMAISTAFRYGGSIYADYENGERELVKSFY